jgi:ABC superfamily ATP binding cassette transporter
MKKIQLKQVLRNKRFVLFTIILPIGWYIFFYQLQKGVSPSILLGMPYLSGSLAIALQLLVSESPQISGFILLNPALQAIVSRTIYGIKASYN